MEKVGTPMTVVFSNFYPIFKEARREAKTPRCNLAPGRFSALAQSQCVDAG
jgi:hypothetical protein